MMHFSDNSRAAGLVVLAMTMISANDAIIKLSSESLSVGQILFIRGLIASILVTVFYISIGGHVVSTSLFSRWNSLRAVCETTATLCFVIGLSLLPIAIASTLVWTAPVFLTLFASVLLHERVAARRWSAVVAGFIGVTLVTRPWSGELSWVMLLPLCAALIIAVRDLVTRKVNPGIDVVAILLPTLVLVTLAGGLLSLWSWQPITWQQVAWLAVSAMLLSGGFYCHIKAVRIGELSFISPFSYMGIISALAWGMIIWDEYPTASTYAGIVLITGAGFYIMRRSAEVNRTQHETVHYMDDT